jgi:hypothetical protein
MISCDVVADAKEKELPDVAATPQSTSSHAASSAMVLTSAVGSGVGGGGANARSDVHQDREWNSSSPRAALAAAARRWRHCFSSSPWHLDWAASSSWANKSILFLLRDSCHWMRIPRSRSAERLSAAENPTAEDLVPIHRSNIQYAGLQLTWSKLWLF